MFHWSLQSMPSSPARCNACWKRATLARYQLTGRRSGTSCTPVCGSRWGSVHQQGTAPMASVRGASAAADASSDVRKKSRRVGMTKDTPMLGLELKMAPAPGDGHRTRRAAPQEPPSEPTARTLCRPFLDDVPEV